MKNRSGSIAIGMVALALASTATAQDLVPERTVEGTTIDVTPNFRRTSLTSRPGSDREHVIAMLTRHGYMLPAKTMSVRLVNLLDDGRRKELMFIYTEALAASGTTVRELEKSENASKWKAMKEALVERALDRIRLVTN